MNVLGPAMSLYVRTVDRWLARAAADPKRVQRRVLNRLLRRAANTSFGREHHFSSLHSHADFVRAVPITDYVSQLDRIERMLAGEPDVCWPGVVRYFAQTSGTTAGDKRIPITRAMQNSNARAAMAIFACYARRGRRLLSSTMRGKLLFLGGSTALTETGAGGWIGDLSGIATHSIRWPLSKHYEPGLELSLLADWEEKIDKIAHRVLHRDVRFITGMPSWVKVLFDRLCELGGVDPAGGIGKLWPNLQLFVHGGVNFDPYRPMFLRYLPESFPLNYLEVYPASEGFIAIQAQADQPGLELLTENGLFYEFVPLSEWGNSDATRLTIDQVELDVPYSLVISTNAGLWAYDIGDVVRFVSLKPPRIVFAGRNKHFINAFGENIIGEHVSQAVTTAAERTGAEVAEFTAAPRYAAPGRPGAHTYVVEFDQPPVTDLNVFAAAIDQTLQRINVDYSIKRKGGLGMTCVEVQPVPPGTFYRWMKQRGKLGGQHKVPVCANNRQYVDELLTLVQDEIRESHENECRMDEACTLKLDPSVMRVSTAGIGKEILDEQAKAAESRTDHRGLA